MLLDLVVQIHDMQDIQELTFVLMQTLHLHVEDRARVNVNSVVLLDIFCKTYFVLILDLHELASCALILHIRFQFRDLGQVCDPAVADLVCDPVCEQRIAVREETSLRDTVRLVVELLRHHLIKILELLMLQDLCMELGNTVYGESGDDRHIRHAHLPIHKDRHLLHFILIARIHLADFDKEPAVDLLHDLVDTGQKLGEKVDRPFFQRLSHDRMVGVRTGLCRHIPRLFPA